MKKQRFRLISLLFLVGIIFLTGFVLLFLLLGLHNALRYLIIIFSILSLGFYLFLDGLISFAYYYRTAEQTLFEHAAQFVRAAVGVFLIIFALLFMFEGFRIFIYF